jgi:hypothetical protein
VKGKIESEITATQDQALKLNIMRQKYYKRKKTANGDCTKFDQTVENII